MPSLTNTSPDAVDVPLFGIGAIEPGGSVDVTDEQAAELAGHPFLSVKTSTTKTTAKAAPAATEGTAVDGN